MKIHLPFFLLALLGLSATARAGSAVATDHYGDFGYSYGPRPERELRREAIARCRAKSRHPEEVDIVVSTAEPGVGIILRFRVDGEQRIYAYVGASSSSEARQYAEDGARGLGGEHIEVVAQWRD